MTTDTKRPVSGREVAIGAIVRDIGLGRVDRLAREDDLLRIEASQTRYHGTGQLNGQRAHALGAVTALVVGPS
jgi:hypothetical protein